MVIEFERGLSTALNSIKYFKHFEFPIYQEPREITNSDELIELYGNTKWAIVEHLNTQYGTNFDLHNWIEYNEDDEVAYFLNEAGSNVLNHSEHKIPSQFHVWLGEKGFIIAIEQKGKGFSAMDVDRNRWKTNKGAAFRFFRTSQSTVFFDNPKNARIVFMEHLLEQTRNHTN